MVAQSALPTVEIVPLGAGQEVGRSCIIVKYMGKTVMLDCGVHPGFKGPASLPFFDSTDIDQVDVMLITHFHLDHVAAMPYVVTKTDFKGRILMTHPTKAISSSLLSDFVRVSRGTVDESLYSEQDLKATLERIELIDFHQTIDLGGIKVTAYRAGHVLGAAMFLLEICGMRLLYTGDYSRLPDRHLSAADVPPEQVDILVVEATYGVNRHEERKEREARLVSKVRHIVDRGGRCLMPVVALGRAQELLLILEEYWEANPDLHCVPIYQASALATRALSIFQTYIEMMNEDIKRAFQAANPFKFKHVIQGSKPDTSQPCVVMATPSMLQGGMSRDLFDIFVGNPRDGLIIADFAVQGTLARSLLDSPKDVLTRDGRKVPLRMSVDAISFSAHADFPQTSEFVAAVKPPHVVLVHGEATNMGRLREALLKQAKQRTEDIQIYMPRVTQAVQIPHRPQHLVKVVGRLADAGLPAVGCRVAGVLVRRGGLDTLVAPRDLPTYTELRPGRIHHRQALPLTRSFSQVRLAMELVFEGLQSNDRPRAHVTGAPPGSEAPSITIADAVTLTLVEQQQQQPELPQPQQQDAAGIEYPLLQQRQQQQPGSASAPLRIQALKAEAAPSLPVSSIVDKTVVKLEAAPPQMEPQKVLAVAGRGDKRAAPSPAHLVMEWEGCSHADMIADAVTAVLLADMEEPAVVSAAEKRRRLAKDANDEDAVAQAEMEIIAALLSSQFGPAHVDAEQKLVLLQVDCKDVVVSYEALLGYEAEPVICSDPTLQFRIAGAVKRVLAAMRPVYLAED